MSLPKVPSIVAGRNKHLEILANKLRDLTESGRGGIVFLEAESGYGKSMLIGETTRLANDAVGGIKIEILISRSNSMEGRQLSCLQC
jgi:ATP/maltotriose-dependent transcriptional regulator MalT